MSFKAWISFFALTLIHQAVASSSTQIPKSIVIGVDGGTESIRACCFNAETGHIVGTSCAVAYSTSHPQPGWAEQSPFDWWRCLGEAVRGAVSTIDSKNPRIEAICLDTTCCSVVALDDALEPLRPSLLWMDQRSASQCREILELAKGDPALNVNSGGMGPLSAEWMIPKALWLKQIEPETYARTRYICEYQDYLNYKLTGIMCASSCNAAARWHWDGVECVNEGKGRPLSLFQKLGMPELFEKLPSKCFAMGEKIGLLSKEAAEHLKLQPNIPIIQGGPDAFVGMIGNGCITPGQMCLITGSSHLHCVVSSEPFTSVGIWGAYKGAPLSHLNFAEGGQSSTGSILRWAKNTLFGGADLSYKDLDDAAAIISPGCDGLVALETFQGSRTPETDPLARGALIGLTLSHTQAHVWRAFLEAVCFGTRACIEGLEQAGHSCQEIIMAGGSTRSPLWLQLHADITGKPVLVCENSDAPLLGCAILAAVGAGIHESVDAAVAKMVRIQKRVDPNPDSATIYDNLYKNVYAKVGGASQPVVHAIARFRGGALVSKEPKLLEQTIEDISTMISPSILACDWAYMARDIQRCVDAGVTRLHVDVFDGVFLDSPHAFSFGPKMVHDIRSSFPDVELDIHLCVDRPERYVQPMEDAGASRILIPWEATDREEGAFRLAEAVVAAGMAFGISLNPETPVEEIFPLLESGMVDTVNILAVNPGFGGQLFQNRVLDKVQRLVSWREKHHFKIMIDGGINPMTATLAKNAGSDILVAGTFIFHHHLGVLSGIQDLLDTE
jgi:ribulose-phosphate 3-epimerase